MNVFIAQYEEYDYDVSYEEIIGIYSTPLRAAHAIKRHYYATYEYKRSRAKLKKNKELRWYNERKNTTIYIHDASVLLTAHSKLFLGSYVIRVYTLNVDERKNNG